MTISDKRKEYEQKEHEYEPVKCHWCHKEFTPAPDGMNKAYLGGYGMVLGCDDCLGLVAI